MSHLVRSAARRALASAGALAVMLVAAPPAMAGCGFLNLSACPKPPVTDPASRIPGVPAPAARQVNQAAFGFGRNPLRGTIRATQRFGTPDPGVVPVVGDVGARADDGSYVMYESRVDDRTIDLMVWSAGLLGPAPVRVQLPPSWGTDPSRRYPALLLLHGGSDPADYQCWTVYSQFKARVGDLDALVVMPSAGAGGHTTNYLNFGFRAGKQYETFVGTELLQILRRGYRMGDHAAVAGASAGARSALELAAKHPDTFTAAAAYSGLLDTQAPGIERTFTLGPLASLQMPWEMWGSPYVHPRIWRDRNPARNIARLRGLHVYVSAGNGYQGRLDTAKYWDPNEAIVWSSTRWFLRAGRRGGLDVTADLYGGGHHTWPYFDDALGRSLPLLAGALGLEAPPQPAPVVGTPT